MYSSHTTSNRNINSDVPNNQAYQSMVNASGGGLTLTTPTLTPTTLKSIQDIFNGNDERFVSMNRGDHPRQGGFVPPNVNVKHFTMNEVNNDLPASASEDDDCSRDSDLSTSRSNTTYNQNIESSSNHSLSNDGSNFGATKKRRGRGTKRTRKEEDLSKLTPEEQKRRLVRRERNKQAAARCRKRRLDHTNELTKETDALEKDRSGLRAELQALQDEYKKLQSSFNGHHRSCKLTKNAVTAENAPKNFSRRPNSLPLNSVGSKPAVSSHNSSGDSLIPIQTPSNGMFTLEGLMDGPSGLTPLLSTPSAGGFLGFQGENSCSGQQRTSADTLPSPDSGSSSKLVSL